MGGAGRRLTEPGASSRELRTISWLHRLVLTDALSAAAIGGASACLDHDVEHPGARHESRVSAQRQHLARVSRASLPNPYAPPSGHYRKDLSCTHAYA